MTRNGGIGGVVEKVDGSHSFYVFILRASGGVYKVVSTPVYDKVLKINLSTKDLLNIHRRLVYRCRYNIYTVDQSLEV